MFYETVKAIDRLVDYNKQEIESGAENERESTNWTAMRRLTRMLFSL